jgi:hypothetical protein
MAVTTAEQVFSVAWNLVKERLRLICGSLERSDGPLRTAADLYLPKSVSCTQQADYPLRYINRLFVPRAEVRSCTGDTALFQQRVSRPARSEALSSAERLISDGVVS